MRILDKAVQMNEEFKPVMLITLELPLTLPQENFFGPLQNGDFVSAFDEANKTYDKQQKVEKK
jgi:hypothetical protein